MAAEEKCPNRSRRSEAVNLMHRRHYLYMPLTYGGMSASITRKESVNGVRRGVTIKCYY